ncbi:peptide/nickel transport system ATP-binding protein [Kibdelosporangium banguiense]|uniref:Peptide/nickel transport system ATP-binding protein n=1 Tax=Kibdelosporangium banguiense TaxID=1365924 RepID=A0ABS4TXW3_9PSEU|nr:ABC transporter ATP-binding protein [Kibdelosporangium banguiense]MBP2329235.1 peptide/nickel transport system ATP-binding protein [Kibdelosporangium banguiense]
MSELAATGLSVRYGSGRRAHMALCDVTVALNRGESLGLAGESGSGKSTLGKALVGLLDPYAGEVSWAGKPLSALPRRGPGSRSRTLQLVFQDPNSSLNQRMTVGATIAEALVVNQIEADVPVEVARLLEVVGLDPRDAGRYPYQFSGGQRQRIALARALAVRPEVMICDEITSSLDVSVQAQILNLLRDIHRETGMGLIVISHNLDVVHYLCRTVCVLRNGEIVEHGQTEQVFTDPRDEYTRELLAAVPRLPS